ncbi:PREDICTED: pleckstrin homology domain-containing family B member 1 [Nanorana parkeri]|uniref:pleckstrin homology domain-containing family B member 1 n=1 Tax=Nanorana parkeri TaxID=125878 RepID=UPI0008541D1D|nr:PREDICTED: pleckstrin homology domain-containing family B member 1 [Nanorana parkeri]
MALVKSGWLWRQSSLLRRWKKHWFDLWMDGGLVYYPDDSRQNIEERITLKYNCLNVQSGQECGEIQPPEGSHQNSLVTVELRDRARLLLCAESEDDAVAWKISLQDMKSTPVYFYNPYDDYYQTVPMNAHHAVYVNHGYCGPGYGPGMTQVVVRDQRDTFGEQMALGLLAGAITSSALSSLIWMPCWF